jgi:ABC-type amino acid transport substrate-binding protein
LITRSDKKKASERHKRMYVDRIIVKPSRIKKVPKRQINDGGSIMNIQKYFIILFLILCIAFLNRPIFAAQGKELEVNKIALTKEEASWIRAHPKITVGVMNAWPPMNFVNESGQPSGFGADYIKALNQRLGGVLEIVPGPFKDNLDKVKAKELDALMDVTPIPERESFLNFTRTYLTIPHVIVARKEGPYYAVEDDLEGKTLALERGFYNVKYFRKKYPGMKIEEYPNTSLALDAVARGQSDAYAGNRVGDRSRTKDDRTQKGDQ